MLENTDHTHKTYFFSWQDQGAVKSTKYLKTAKKNQKTCCTIVASFNTFPHPSLHLPTTSNSQGSYTLHNVLLYYNAFFSVPYDHENRWFTLHYIFYLDTQWRKRFILIHSHQVWQPWQWNLGPSSHLVISGVNLVYTGRGKRMITWKVNHHNVILWNRVCLQISIMQPSTFKCTKSCARPCSTPTWEVQITNIWKLPKH